jgi:hypothetical protein
VKSNFSNRRKSPEGLAVADLNQFLGICRGVAGSARDKRASARRADKGRYKWLLSESRSEPRRYSLGTCNRGDGASVRLRRKLPLLLLREEFKQFVWISVFQYKKSFLVRQLHGNRITIKRPHRGTSKAVAGILPIARVRSRCLLGRPTKLSDVVGPMGWAEAPKTPTRKSMGRPKSETGTIVSVTAAPVDVLLGYPINLSDMVGTMGSAGAPSAQIREMNNHYSPRSGWIAA